MGRPDYARTLTRLRALIAAGHSLRQCATALATPRSTLHALLAAGEVARLRPARLRHERLRPEQRRTLQRHLRRDTMTLSQIARLSQVHKSTVSRYRRKTLQAVADAAADEGFRPQRVARAQRCPSCHRLVNVLPCVACAALKGRPQP
jgi:DNA-binding transcriptional MerR regulator